MKRCYVSGPMTGLPDNNFPAFNEAARQLRADGYLVANPARKGIIEGWEWVDYLKYDIKKLMDCDAIWMLPGWQRSKGACLEYHLARELKMEILGDE